MTELILIKMTKKQCKSFLPLCKEVIFFINLNKKLYSFSASLSIKLSFWSSVLICDVIFNKRYKAISIYLRILTNTDFVFYCICCILNTCRLVNSAGWGISLCLNNCFSLPVFSEATDAVTVEPLKRKTRSTLFTAGANLVPVTHQGAPAGKQGRRWTSMFINPRRSHFNVRVTRAQKVYILPRWCVNNTETGKCVERTNPSRARSFPATSRRRRESLISFFF